jgi:2-haloalkanoic acid dehalogenase type II
MRSILAICFDLDNTLWDVWPAIVRAEQEMYAFLSERYPRICAKYSIEGLRAARERVIADEPHMSHDFTYLRLASLRRCADEVGYEASLAEEAFAIFFAARNAVTLYQDAEHALPELRARYRLFSLTNGNADLRAIGLHDFFEHRFAAREVGALKPDPKAFRHVLEQTSLAPQQILFVGDDPVADIQGARSVGMQGVWMNRGGALWSTDWGPAPLSIAKLTELLPLLERLG